MLVIAGVFGLFLLGKTNQASNSQQEITKTESKLTVNETVHDFGMISMADGNVAKIFQVSNSSDQDIVLTKIYTSCMCTIAYLIKQDGNKKGPFGMFGHGGSSVNENIKAGEIRDIEVVYDPNAHGPAGIGIVERFIYLEDSDGGILQLEIKAKVTP